MSDLINRQLQQELSLQEWQVTNVIQLIDEGMPIFASSPRRGAVANCAINWNLLKEGTSPSPTLQHIKAARHMPGSFKINR